MFNKHGLIIDLRYNRGGNSLNGDASGLVMEGEGLQPHIFLEQSLDDILSGKDRVLELLKTI